MECLQVDGNQGWYITQLLDLKKQYESKMQSIDYDYINTLARKKAAEATKKLAEKKAEEDRMNAFWNSPQGKSQKAKEAEIAEKLSQDSIIYTIIFLLVVVAIFCIYFSRE